MGPEHRLTAKVLEHLKEWQGVGWHKKMHGGPYGMLGLPDILGCWHGIPYAIELKAPGKEPTKLQEKELGNMAVSGYEVAVVHDLKELESFLSRMERRRENV